jgi:hypothetical protein
MGDIWVNESYVVGVYLSSTENEVERILQGNKWADEDRVGSGIVCNEH